MIYRLLAILLLTLQLGLAQTNLVPNPSFEEYTDCPSNLGQINLANSWNSASGGSPDYYNSCSTNNFTGIPCNGGPLGGCQAPHTGNAYAGIATYDDLFGIREYFEIKLNDTLKSGRKYYVGLYLSSADNVKYFSNNIGILFCSNFYNNNSTTNIPISPTVNFSSIQNDNSNWVNLESQYIANGNETHILIGNFYNNLSTSINIQNANSANTIAYYYFDDIYVYEINETSINIYPNPAKDIINIQLNNINTQNAYLLIYDTLGQLVLKEKITSDQQTINTQILASGMYTINISDGKNNIAKQKFLISH